MIPRVPFYFLRHGQTDWNVEGRMQGHTDIPLNDVGVEQARAALERLRGEPVEGIVCSTLSRARQTAEIVAKGLDLPVVYDAGLMERTFGSFEGKLTKEMRALHGLREEGSISKILPPDAEQWPQTLARVTDVMGRHLQGCGRKRLLFVGHGAFFRAMYEQMCQVRMEAKNATPYHFAFEGGVWLMREVGV